jgi:polysaccharide chain length determinant protein (PEP-CTERM system associated)
MLPGQQFSPDEILRILRRRWWVIVLPFAIVAPSAALYVRTIPDLYQSETMIMVVPQRVPESYVRSTVTARIEDRLQSIQQQILTRSRLERMILDFNLYEEERRNGVLMEDLVARMSTSDVDVRIERGDAFRIQFVNGNPRLAQKVTERLATMFIDENLRDREVLSEGTSQFLDTELENARRRLIEQEKRLEEYKRQYAGQLPTQVTTNSQAVTNLQTQIRSISESINLDRQQRLVLERSRADIESANSAESAASAPAARPDPGASLQAQQLEAARVQLRALETRNTPDHPSVRNARRLVTELEAALNGGPVAAEGTPGPAQPAESPAARARAARLRSLDADIALIDSQIAKKAQDEERLKKELNGYQARIDAAPTREAELTELMRDYTTLQAQYTSLGAKREDSKLAANLERRQIGEQFRILDPARVPEQPISPNRVRLNMMGAAVGLGLGIAIAALLEIRDSSFRTAKHVTQVLNLPVLAMIPMMMSDAARARRRRRLLLAAAGAFVLLACCAGAVLAAWKLELL